MMVNKERKKRSHRLKEVESRKPRTVIGKKGKGSRRKRKRLGG
jgi:hypothetical protein